MKTIVHVHRQRLRAGKPAIIVKTYRTLRYTTRYELAPGVVIVQPETPLSCGAKVWIEIQP